MHITRQDGLALNKISLISSYKRGFDHCYKEPFGVLQRNDSKLKAIINSVQKYEMKNSEFPEK